MSYQVLEFGDKPIFHKILAFIIVFLLTITPVHAGVGEGPYLTLSGTVNMYEDIDLMDVSTHLDPIIQSWGSYLNIDSGLGFNHSIGYSFGNAFSMEVEFSSQGGKFGRACSSAGCAEGQKSNLDGDIETKSLLVNAIHYFNSSEPLSPYVGYGVGTAFHEATLYEHDDGAQTTFAYQFKTGLELQLNQHIDLLMGYRFFTTDEPNFGFFRGGVTTHSLEAGIKYNF